MTELAATLDGLIAFVRRYVVLSEAQLVAVALWIAHTFALDAAEQSPYLEVSSATKRSGKSRLLDLLELLTARPWKVISPSEAVVFRKLDAGKPTLLLDEVDAIWGGKGAENHEGLRAILNAGNRRGTVVPRCVGPRQTLVDFHIFGAKALAGIGRLPDTVADRAIPIRLRRKTPTETVERFRRRGAAQDAEPLALSIASIMEHLVPELEEARPGLPDELDDRAQDGWEPLLAIADAAEGEWPARARAAAVELSGDRDDQDDAVALRLLGDIRNAFDTKATDRLSTSALLEELAADAEAPWATWHKDEKPLSARKLADMLRPFEIHSRNIRFTAGEAQAKGYMRVDFADAWLRYLTPEPDAQSTSTGFLSVPPSQPASANGLRAAAHPSQDGSGTDAQHVANPHEHSDGTAGRIENPNLEEGRLLAAGDEGFLNVVRGAHRAGHLTHSEYRERVATHGLVRRS